METLNLSNLSLEKKKNTKGQGACMHVHVNPHALQSSPTAACSPITFTSASHVSVIPPNVTVREKKQNQNGILDYAIS